MIDIAHRIVALEGAAKPHDYQEAIVLLGQVGVLPSDFAHQLAPLAGFRNVLVHESVRIDWDEVYSHLRKLGDLQRFAELIRRLLSSEV